MKAVKLYVSFGVLFLSNAIPAFAYVGPGPGLNFIGMFLMFLSGFLLTVVAVFLWPIRYFIKKLKKRNDRKKKSS